VNGEDPIVSLVTLEGAGAILGLVVALFAVVATEISRSSTADAVGSIAVGVLLCLVGTTLAYDTRRLLVGETVPSETREAAVAIILGTDGVEDVTEMVTLHVAPDTILVALKVRFRAGMSVEQSERVVGDMEERVRAKIPRMKKIFVEADRDFGPV
jgi:divalent metal cation (Fe/Co/Zn/Cd) transporter